MSKLNLMLLFLLIWLQYSLWFGKNGLYDYNHLIDKAKKQQIKNNNLKIKNDQLLSEVNDLNNNQEAIEEKARNELSMTKKGEIFYRLVPSVSNYLQDSEK